MEDITLALGRRVDSLFATVDDEGAIPAPEADRSMHERMAPLLGDAAALLERLEFQPAGPRPQPAPRAGATAGKKRRAGPPVPPAGSAGPAHPAVPPAPPAPAPPIVIDLSPLLEQAREAAAARGTAGGTLDDVIRRGLELAAAGAGMARAPRRKPWPTRPRRRA
jgi:hypothetical protein